MPHDGPGEHYHDIGDRVAGHGDTVIWTTVGLDIGSSTSQAVFSKVTLVREDAYYSIVERSVLHQSEVILTPYATPELIDRVRLAEFIEREFATAHLTRAEIDNGAVIMTGLALSASNARAIADIVADEAGNFVAVSAGDLLEARLAASGAGVCELSLQNPGLILHIDIGGGTTKMSSWREGKLLRLAAIDVGARQIRLDAERRILNVEAPVARVAGHLNLDLRVGERLSEEAEERLATSLALAMLRLAGILADRSAEHWLLRTPPLFAAHDLQPIQAVVFSGGVSEYIYGRERREFGDMGVAIGRAVRRGVEAAGVRILDSTQGIRATVLGASQHSVQLSGNTIFVSDASRLPLRNLPVLFPDVDLLNSSIDAVLLGRELDNCMRLYANVAAQGAAIAVRWGGSPTYERLGIVADAIALAVKTHFGPRQPCVVIVDGDVAGLLGSRLHQCVEAGRAVICLDGVLVHEFDHVDLGELGRHQALPVVVKSLLFAQATGRAHVNH